MENWKPVKGYGGRYSVSDRGLVRRNAGTRCRETRVLKPWPGTRPAGKPPYMLVTLYRDRVAAACLVHRLVALAFVPNPRGKPQVNHENGDTTDNRAANLTWATNGENQRHRFDVLGRRNPRGSAHAQAKLTEKDVVAIRRLAAAGDMTHAEIAARFRVKRPTIRSILYGRKWKHVAP